MSERERPLSVVQNDHLQKQTTLKSKQSKYRMEIEDLEREISELEEAQTDGAEVDRLSRQLNERNRRSEMLFAKVKKITDMKKKIENVEAKVYDDIEHFLELFNALPREDNAFVESNVSECK